MHIMYIDESGDTISLSQKGKKFLVLTGCIFHEHDVQHAEEEFREIKQAYYRNPDIEIKSNFLRYANPDLQETSPLKLRSRKQYNALERAVTVYLKNLPVRLYSIVIDKGAYWNQHPSHNPYYIAYVFLLERFEKYLTQHHSLGICIIDPREGQVEKHFMGNELARLHNKMRWEDGAVWKKCPHIIEKLLFSQSDTTVGIQVADLFCYPIYHMFEYNKPRGTYWRFDELSYPKLIKGPGEKTRGWGLKFFPSNTKKDLHLFE